MSLRILLAGTGNIGRRHIKNLRQLLPSVQVTVYHSGPRQAGEAAPVEGADRVVYDLESALAGGVDAAIIATPSALHIDLALALAQNSCHLFIEKPLSNSLEGLEALSLLSQTQGRVVLVGYNFRYYAPLNLMRSAIIEGQIGTPWLVRAEVGQYLPDWRPGKDHRRSASGSARLGGGAILELSHELDYVRWLMGEVVEVSALAGGVGDLQVDVETIAEISLRFENGALGNIHQDMLQRSAYRTCRVAGSEGTLVWTWADHRVAFYSARAQTWHDLNPSQDLDRNAMYLAEMAHFIDCIEGKAGPLVNLAEGKRVLEIALAAKQSAREGRVIAVKAGP